MKKRIVILLVSGCVLLLSLAPFTAERNAVGVAQTVAYFKERVILFADAAVVLEKSIQELDEHKPETIDRARTALVNCRLGYKSIEFFFSYFFRSLTIIYNSPAVVEVEEPFLEYREPTGLQVIAGLLFSKEPVKVKKQLLQQAYLVREASQDIPSLLHKLPVDDAKILESVRLALMGVITIDITGFETLESKSGIAEAHQVLSTISQVIQPYLTGADADSVRYYLSAALQTTANANSFDQFDRLAFLTNAALPLQHHLGLLIRNAGLEINTGHVFNYGAKHLFSPDALNINAVQQVNATQAALGKALFFETALSGNQTRSCASCHAPERSFSDGVVKSIAIDGHSSVKRNSPTLFYAAWQHNQFWDGRAKSLGEQVGEVLVNPIEMNGNYDSVMVRLSASPRYRQLFAAAFAPGREKDLVSIPHIAEAIAAYIKTLAPFNSPFDEYIRGNKKALTKSQVKGFNLFTGKATCATCHSLPLFNGLTPPLFDLTAMEVIGTTSDTNFVHTTVDADSGRYTSYPIEYYLRSFKTPGLRNVAATAPYMHNGAFPDLESVLDFYNKGGGAGIGLQVPHQTLSPEPLNLTPTEIRDVINFLQALTDRAPVKK